MAEKRKRIRRRVGRGKWRRVTIDPLVKQQVRLYMEEHPLTSLMTVARLWGVSYDAVWDMKNRPHRWPAGLRSKLEERENRKETQG